MTTVRYWAAARTAAGTTQDEIDADTLAEAITAMTQRRGEKLARVLTVCSYVVDGQPTGQREPHQVDTRNAKLLDVLPPFAGG